MKMNVCFLRILAPVLTLLGTASTSGAAARPQGPCDIYGAAGTPCVAAHSTTRALYASYNGPLYQVKRQSDGKTLDIGMLNADGFADAAAQDAFCAHTICFISLIYDQSPKRNHLYQAAPGTFKGPAKGGFDTQPIADMAPVTIGGHKAYGVYIMPGMGLRNNNAVDIPINDDPEGIYYVIDGTHYDSGCCFDYGNSSTNGKAVGTGTMETTYFGTATAWGSGNGPGPWIMSDMEAGLFSGYNAKQNAADPTVGSWRFVTAVVDGGGGNKWDLRGGNAQTGGLTTFYSGIRPGSPSNDSYYPMHKQGGILLGTGGDNGNGSSGTFYEGVMTTGYPTEATTDAVQANVVAARYDVARVSLSRVASFTPGVAHDVTVAFTNAAGASATNVRFSVSAPGGWTVQASGTPVTFAGPVAPGASVSATFRVTSPAATEAGFLLGKAEWTGAGAVGAQSDAATQRLRNAPAVRINEVRLGAGANPANQFIELYNASADAVDISRWSVIHTQSQWTPVPLATIPSGARLPGHGFYLLGLASSGLVAPASAGSATINVRTTAGFAAGQKIEIDGEPRTVSNVGTPAAAMTTLFVPVSTGPWITLPAGSTNLPVTNAAGFAVGEKIGIDVGGNYEVATVTAVGKAATQTTLASAAVAGATNIRLAADSNVSVGDTLTLGTGARREMAAVAGVGTPGATGTGVGLSTPLRFDHMSGIDVSDAGTGIGFAPGTRFPHTSGDAVQALGSGITLDAPLASPHAYGAPVVNPQAGTTAYQGPPAPNQWFGNALSASAGSLALMDAGGAVVVDAMVYGSRQSNSSGNGTIASPELATLEGDQGKGGCIVVVPPGASAAANRSLGRFPDGNNTGNNCTDFRIQPATILAAATNAGANNIKVGSVADFSVGQTITVDAGPSAESVVIAAVGTAGGTTIGADIISGVTVIPVTGVAGFAAGMTLAIDDGAHRETAIVASAAGGGRGGGTARITVTAPLTLAHTTGAQVSGTGIDLATGLTRTHASGAQVSGNAPTPGAANRY